MESDGQFLNREEQRTRSNMIPHLERVMELRRESFLRRLGYGVDLYALLVVTPILSTWAESIDTYCRQKDNVPPLGPVVKIRRRDRQSHEATA